MFPRAGRRVSTRRSRFEETDMPKSSSRRELVPGTLDMLVLDTLTLGSLHGYAIAQHIEKLSEEVLCVEQGSLYPALERLQRQGFVTLKWGQTPTGRRAR